MNEVLRSTGVPRMTSDNTLAHCEVHLLSNKVNKPQKLLSSFTPNARLDFIRT